jgi:hypothetical protein
MSDAPLLNLHKPSRRDLLVLAGAIAAGLNSAGAIAQTVRRTPSQILGPFYPVHKPVDQDADLTTSAGRSGRATGQIIEVMGRVINRRGEPVAGARIEIWQANTHGRYYAPERSQHGASRSTLRRLRAADHGQRGPVPVRIDQARRLSGRFRDHAGAAHSLRRAWPQQPPRDPDVLRGRPAERYGPHHPDGRGKSAPFDRSVRTPRLASGARCTRCLLGYRARRGVRDGSRRASRRRPAHVIMDAADEAPIERKSVPHAIARTSRPADRLDSQS